MHCPRLLTLLPVLSIAPLAATAQLSVDAGPDVVLECDSGEGAEYTLNGRISGAADPDFSWSNDRGVVLANDDTLTPTGRFPTGRTLVTLEARAGGDSDRDTAQIRVEDSEPPVARARAHPRVLWPPNHSMHEVTVAIRSRDRCRGADGLGVELLSVESDEPDNGIGDGNTTRDIQGAELGEDDRHVLLRAERAGPGDGRVYTLRYRITDAAGNETDVEARVHVPHDFADAKRLLEHEMQGDRDAMGEICPRPDAAADQFSQAVPDLSVFSSRSACNRACQVWGRGCLGIVKGSSRCVKAERRSLFVLEKTDCLHLEDRARRRACLADARDMARDLKAELDRATQTGLRSCEDTAVQCARACEGLFANGDFAVDDSD